MDILGPRHISNMLGNCRLLKTWYNNLLKLCVKLKSCSKCI